MNNMSWDGHDLMAAMRHAAAVLHSQVDEVNALNVFPVPDGDTGSNMLATMQAAVAEAESVAPLERTATRVAAAISLGALMGARGNSGVILSQLLRGMSEAIAGHDRVDAAILVEALKRGCTTAFGAVAHPVEGTILTVARDVADATARAPRGDGSLEHILRVAVDAAAASVLRTPELLPVLREAGVVDAGGRGIELLLRGALASIRGEHLPRGMKLPHDIVLPTRDGLEAEGYGYETVFVILPPEGARLDPAAIRARLDRMADSVLVAGDDRAVKIHVHNERPDKILGYGLTLGTLSRINIENLDRQATDVRERAKLATERALISGVAPMRDGPAIVAVAAGDGLSRVFSSLGVTGVVQGGQGENPSVGEIADAIRGSGNREVIVLPNNPNVRLAAKQAGELCPDVYVEVVPTRNAAEGIAALLAFDPEMSVKDAAKAMNQAARAVQTLQVTRAVRDARIGRRKVQRGNYIVLGPNDGLVAADSDRTSAIRSGIGLLKNGYELLTLYRGRDVDHAAGQQLRDQLATELDGVEIELVEGGQPHYDFLIAAE
ncbi:MAG: DAK2 domain-containing protein [Chloroflexota bacterium]|nr:DAK2 domain-containing protein [Chloroflexota bacterium]